MIENFNELTFERKIDVLVVIHVFKKEVVIYPRPHINPIYYTVYTPSKVVDGIHRFDEMVAYYSTLLISSWEIVRKFEYIYLFHNKNFKKGQWECKLVYDETIDILGTVQRTYAWAETEQLAICYAGLKAVGFDLKEFLKKEGKHENKM